jgi:hypothetical protein
MIIQGKEAEETLAVRVDFTQPIEMMMERSGIQVMPAIMQQMRNEQHDHPTHRLAQPPQEMQLLDFVEAPNDRDTWLSEAKLATYGYRPTKAYELIHYACSALSDVNSNFFSIRSEEVVNWFMGLPGYERWESGVVTYSVSYGQKRLYYTKAFERGETRRRLFVRPTVQPRLFP